MKLPNIVDLEAHGGDELFEAGLLLVVLEGHEEVREDLWRRQALGL